MEVVMLRYIFASLFALSLACISWVLPAQAGEWTFDDFPGLPYTEAHAPAYVSVDSPFWEHRDDIRAGADENEVNFNGAFTVIEFENTGVLVDRTDGKVYGYLPTASHGYLYVDRSNLFIANPDDGELYAGYVPKGLWQEFYYFENGEFKFLGRNKGNRHDLIGRLDTPHPIHPTILEELEESGAVAQVIAEICTKDPASTLCGD